MLQDILCMILVRSLNIRRPRRVIRDFLLPVTNSLVALLNGIEATARISAGCGADLDYSRR